MLLAELLGELDFVTEDRESLDEGARLVWSKRNDRLERKFRCTSGPRKGSTTTNPYDCGLMPKRRWNIRKKGK